MRCRDYSETRSGSSKLRCPRVSIPTHAHTTLRLVMYHATTPTAVVAPRASPHGSRASRRSNTTPRRTTTLFSARVDVALNHVRRDDGVTSTGTSLRARHSRGRSLTRVGAKKGFFDEMLDVMEGGPKLRKWYGQDSSVGAPGAERPDPLPAVRVMSPTTRRHPRARRWLRRGTSSPGEPRW